MSKPSEIIVLCEDDEHEVLVRAYLKVCGLGITRPLNASRIVHGGNVGWVLQQFPIELRACRQRHNVRANTLLIAVADADNYEVAERRNHFQLEPPISPNDPVVILIPKRHVETWIRTALGSVVNERDDYKNPKLEKTEIRQAANAIHAWARDNPPPVATIVPSLRTALSEWRRIG